MFRLFSILRYLVAWASLILISTPTLAQVNEPNFEFIEDWSEDQLVLNIFLENNESSTYSIKVELQLKGMRSRLPEDAIFVVAPGQKQRIASLKITTKSWQYTYQTRYIIGSTEAQHDDQVIYQLPYPSSHRFPVTQGYHGTFSHAGFYAIDWGMPEQTPVLAARGGVVVDLSTDSKEGCPDPSCMHMSNFIRIEHSDGTIGSYAHLAYASEKVTIGQKVKKGEILARSGNTGWSSRPHLHFMVSISKFGKRPQGVPTLFATAKGAIRLEEGMVPAHPKQ